MSTNNNNNNNDKIFSVEKLMERYQKNLHKYGLDDLLPKPQLDPTVSKIVNDFIPAVRTPLPNAKCTCPPVINTRDRGKKSNNKKAKKGKMTFETCYSFIPGTNNNGYEIKCAVHGRRSNGF